MKYSIYCICFPKFPDVVIAVGLRTTVYYSVLYVQYVRGLVLILAFPLTS